MPPQILRCALLALAAVQTCVAYQVQPSQRSFTGPVGRPRRHAPASNGVCPGNARASRRAGLSRGELLKGSAGALLISGMLLSTTPLAAVAKADKAGPSILDSNEVDAKSSATSQSSSTVQAAEAAAVPALKEESQFKELISGLAGGAASRASKEILLHPIDTIKTRLQYAKGNERPEDLFKDLYSGVWPALLAGTPAGAAFFGTKDFLKGVAKSAYGDQYRELITIATVFLANLPYWAIRTPGEAIKTRQQAGLVKEGMAAVSAVVKEEGVGRLYAGFTSNVAYAFPTDALKFLVYESLQRSWRTSVGGRKLDTLESSVCGSAASCVAQFLSTPLDVVRTRVMTESGSVGDIVGTGQTIVREEGVLKLFSGLTPRLSRAVFSGAIQFGSYEFVRGLFK